MKITYNPRIGDEFELAKRQANIGCDKCPVCGETRSFQYMKRYENERLGIEKLIPKRRKIGFFHRKYYIRDIYLCNTCGTKWESDEYQYRRNGDYYL